MSATPTKNAKHFASNLKTRTVCAAALLLSMAHGAFANGPSGFVDERGANTASAQGDQKVSAAVKLGQLTGDFAAAEWGQVVPASGTNGSALSLAVIRLLPTNRPSVEIDAPESLVDKLVHWGEGLTRRQALEEIAKSNALHIGIEPRTITIKSAAPAAPVKTAALPVAPSAKGALPSPIGVLAGTPVATTSKAFEIRLNDIKISTSMNRWATENGVRIRWDADKHVLVGAPQTFHAESVFEAVTQALSTPGIKNSDYPLEVCEYPNTPPLLRVTRQGEQTKDCPS